METHFAPSHQMLQNMKDQFAEHLLAAGFVNSKNPKDRSSNINSGTLPRLSISSTAIYICTFKDLSCLRVLIFEER